MKIVAWVGFLAALALATAPCSAAPATSSDIQRAAEAITAQTTAATARSSDAPRLHDPASAKLLRAAFDRDGIRALPLDLASMLPVCDAVSGAFSALTAWSVVPSNSSASEVRFLGLQDELTIAATAGDLCTKRMLRAAERFAMGLPASERTPTRRQGIRQMQTGAQMILEGLVEVQADPGLTMANRTLLLSGLLEDVDTVAGALTPATRTEVRAKILRAAQASDSASRSKLTKLADAYARTDCGLLCTISKEQ